MFGGIKPIRVPILGVDNYSGEFSRAEKRIGGFSKRVGAMGRGMTTAITLPLAAIATGAVKASFDINKSMANIATLIPGNIERVKELKVGIQDLAKFTGKGSADIADGVYQVISAFGDTSDTLSLVKTNAMAATAGLATTTDAINLTSAVTKAYGDTSAGAVSRAADLAFQTVKLGQTTFPELAGSIGRVTPLAKTMGVRLEEMFGVMATGTGVTGNAAEVSTQLASVLTAMIKPTGEMESLYNHLGVTSGKALIEQMGFAGALNTIVSKADRAGVSLGKLLGRKEAMIMALSLTGAQADTFTEKLAAMENSSGALSEAFREQTEGINKTGHAWNQMVQTIVVAAQRLGDKLAPKIMAVTELVKPFVSWVLSLNSGVTNTVLVLAAIAAVIGPVLVGFGAIGAAIASVLLGFSAISMIIGPLLGGLSAIGVTLAALSANPIVLIVAAIVALTFIIIRFRKEIVGGLVKAWNTIWSFTDTRIGQILVAMNPLVAIPLTIAKNWESITSVVGRVGSAISRVTQPFAGWFGGDSSGSTVSPEQSAAAATDRIVESRRTEIRKEETTVRVAFDNLPQGTRVRQTSGGLLDMDIGYALAAP